MEKRLPNPKKAEYIKTGLQVKEKTYKALKMAATNEERHYRDIINDALLMYLESKHADILKFVK